MRPRLWPHGLQYESVAQCAIQNAEICDTGRTCPATVPVSVAISFILGDFFFLGDLRDVIGVGLWVVFPCKLA